MTIRCRRVISLLVALMLLCHAAFAAQPVIEEGREQDALALLSPHALGNEVGAGYRLWEVRIESTQIRIGLRTPDDTDVWVLRLVHPSGAPAESERSKSFAIVVSNEGKSGAAAAPTQALVSSIQRNDRGGFWRVERELRPPGADEQVVGFGWRAWLSDGLVLYLLIAALAIALAARALSGQPRWIALSLIALTVGGLALRWLMAPHTALGAWPYSRLYAHARLTFNGPLLALASKLWVRPIYLTELISAITLAYAALAPLAVFSAARRLLGEVKSALAAAAVIACLPQHVRFSAAEDGALPSLTLAALALALVLSWLEDESRVWRVLSLIALPPLLVFLFALRPLNNLYALVLLALPLLPKSPGSRSARALVVAVCTALAVYGAFALAADEPTAAAEGLRPRLIVSALEVLTSPRLNTLINPWVTPPLTLVMAVLGGVTLWKSSRRALLLWLVAWMLGFLVVHSVVLEPQMHPRYHLPLAIPLALLAGLGLTALFDWKPRVGWAGVVYLAAMPLMHASFIRDLDFTDLHEYAFVRRLRETIPAGCRVIEYAGERAEDARFPRIGALLERGVVKNRWKSSALVTRPDRASLDASVLTELKTPAACTYLYQGLPCVAVKKPELPLAAECQQLLDAAPLTRIDGQDLAVRAYNSAALRDLARGENRVTISLHRAGRAP